MPPEHSRSWSPAKLASDKEQSRCHNHRHRRNDSISSDYNPYDEQHEPELRIQHKFPRSSAVTAQTSMSSLRHNTEEPDFVIEERAAWSRISPNATLRSPIRTRKNEPVEFTLYDEYGMESTDDEEYGPVQRLAVFAPVSGLINTNDRPKTSRGPESSDVFPQQNIALAQTHSRFQEGSMGSKSAAVSSSWSQYSTDYEASESETNQSDTTPKASHVSRSSSIDIQDFQPPPVSASTVKRTLFRRRKYDQYHDKGRRQGRTKKPKAEEDGIKKPRKSKSSWNLHAIGEKIGLFNNSSASVNDAEDVVIPEQSPSKTNVLDDRKRKAEEAYTQQFGSKKQKHNTSNQCAYMSEPDQPVTMRRRTAAADANATIRARHGSHSQRPMMDNTISRKASLTDHDTRKQQTMKELQKENQILRDLLQDQQTIRDGTVTRRPRPTKLNAIAPLPLHDATIRVSTDDVPPVPSLSSERKPLGSVANMKAYVPSSTTKADTSIVLAANHPVLKPSPSSRNPHLSITGRRKSLPPLPRPVSMIMEEPEDEIEKVPSSKEEEARPKTKFVIKNATRKSAATKVELGKENEVITNDTITLGQMGNRKEDWDGWDEDVF